MRALSVTSLGGGNLMPMGATAASMGTGSSHSASSLADQTPPDGGWAGPGAHERDTEELRFVWRGGGEQVFVTGSFNGWRQRVPLVERDGAWAAEVSVAPGEHQYKFIVDGAWRLAEDQAVITDGRGLSNNWVAVGARAAASAEARGAVPMTALLGEKGRSGSLLGQASGTSLGTTSSVEPRTPPDQGIGATQMQQHARGGAIFSTTPMGMTPVQAARLLRDQLTPDGGVRMAAWGRVVPGPEAYAKPPALLPPQLVGSMLNGHPDRDDNTVLPVPQHVMLKHLYTLDVNNGMRVLGATKRFAANTYISTIYFAPDDHETVSADFVAGEMEI